MSSSLSRSVLAALALCAVTPVYAADVSACLITKTDTNPFFVKMKEGAQAKAKELGVKLQTFAGKIDGDTESQVQAIETCIASGAKGILLVPSDSAGIVPQVKKARDAGILVIALDTGVALVTDKPIPGVEFDLLRGGAEALLGMTTRRRSPDRRHPRRQSPHVVRLDARRRLP
ncbi:MAG: substrate-binding domain-containing protein [Amaricoccus sp.]|uniref:substrate-binding domain-containing protein n=1 Tax=Amaricoccus sp. TaxID=1872485 RepID=UPI0039E4645C